MGNNQASISLTEHPIKGTKFSSPTTKMYSANINHISQSIIIFGGFPGDNNNIYELSLENYEWNQIQTNGIKPTARFGHKAVINHEKMYIFGGEDKHGNKLNDLTCLNLETYEWEEINALGSLPAIRSGHSCVMHKHEMILFGGERGGSGGHLNDCFSFNFDTFTWKFLSIISKTSPSPRSDHSAGVHGNLMIIFGGRNNHKLFNDLYTLNLESKVWSKIQTYSLPPPKFGSSLMVRGGMMYLFGGFYDDNTPSNTLSILPLVTEQPKSLISSNSSLDLDQKKTLQKFKVKLKLSSEKKEITERSWVHLSVGEYLSNTHSYKSLISGGKLYILGGDINGQYLTKLFETDVDAYQRIMNVPFSEIKIGEKIGEGTFRNVFKGTFRGEEVCIKMLKQKELHSSWEKYVNEINVLRQLKHPNILGFRCVSASPPNYCLVTEFACNGALNAFLSDKKTTITMDLKVKMALDVARGLQYLHSQAPPIIHGNLSSDNLLVTSENRILISDFFLSIRPFTSASNIQEKIKLFGTPYYLSPEVLGNEVPDACSDVYSLGVVMWEIYSRKPLYSGEKDFVKLSKKIQEGDRPISIPDLTKLIENEKDENAVKYLKLVKHSWAQDPDDRPTLDHIIVTLRELVMKKATFQNDNSNQNLAKYETVKLIGQGGQAQVYLVKEKSSSNLYAMKKFHPKKMAQLNDTLQEMRAMVGLNHPNIIQIKDFFISNIDKHGYCNFNIVMDYLDGGDLEHFIKAQTKPVTNDFLYPFLSQVLDAIRYIHSKYMMHRDLKPGNILLMSNSSVVKIGDLGLATNIEVDQKNQSYCGTIAYMAPEQRNHKPYDYSIDIWAIGIILFELVTLKPFNYEKFISKKNHYLHEVFKPLLDFDQVFFDIIEECLTINPKQRPSAEDLLLTLIDATNNTPNSAILKHQSFSFEKFHGYKSSPDKDDDVESPRIRSRSSTLHSPTESPLLQEQPNWSLDVTSPRRIRRKSSFSQKPQLKMDSYSRNTSPISNGNSISIATIKSPSPSSSDTIEVPMSHYEILLTKSVPNALDVTRWNPSKVSEWLAEMGMDCYSASFLDHEINGEALLELSTIEEFNYLNVKKLGHIKLLQKYIKIIKMNSNQ